MANLQTLLQETRTQLPDASDPEVFRHRFTLLTLTRNGKDLSRFLYAANTRGDGRYVALLPRAVATSRRRRRSRGTSTIPWPDSPT